MKCLDLTTHSPEETRETGRAMGVLACRGDVFLLVGELGTGKTCLTQGIAWGLDISEYTLSPTFVIMRELHGRLPLYHIDLYRLDNIEEIADLGLDDYLYGEGVCVVEWGDKGRDVMPPEHLLVEIGYLPGTERSFRFTPCGKRYREMLAELAERIPAGKGT